MSNQADTHVSNRIRQARLLRGLTQAQLAAQIGCSFQQLQKYEAGQNRVSAGRLWEISRALSIQPSYFFEGLAPGDTAAEAIDSTTSRIMFALARIDNAEVRDTLCRMVLSIVESEAGRSA